MNRSAHQNGRNSMRFRETERIATIPGSVSFANATSITCNPALAASFPWLSGHAALFENYKIHRLVYRYKNLKGTASAGNIILSFDYDTLDAAPSSAVAATQSTHYIDGAPWRIFQLQVPTNNRILFTRVGAITGADLKTYDMGALHISTEGCADTSDHGYLEVEYDIEFFNKQTSAITSYAPPAAYYYLASDQTFTADAAVDWTESYNGLGSSNATPSSVVVQPGVYRVKTQVRFVGGGDITSVGIRLGGSALTTPTEAIDRTSGTDISLEAIVEVADVSYFEIWVVYATGTVTFSGQETKLILQKL